MSKMNPAFRPQSTNFAKILLALASLVLVTLPAPLHAQERQWGLDVADEDAYLVFGVPETDDVGASFWCKIGSKRIRFFTPLPASTVEDGKPAMMTLTINGKDYALKGQGASNSTTHTASVEAELPSTDPIFEDLQKADRISVKVGKHVAVYPLADANFPDLINICTTRPQAN